MSGLEVLTRYPDDLSALEFGTAFRIARKAGSTSFDWRGCWYHTLEAEELEQTGRPWSAREDRMLLVAAVNSRCLQALQVLLQRTQTDLLARLDALTHGCQCASCLDLELRIHVDRHGPQ